MKKNFKIFGKVIELVDELDYTPPDGKAQLTAAIWQDDDGIFYINNFITPKQLKDASSKLVNTKPAERNKEDLITILGPDGSICDLDTTNKTSILRGILIANVTLTVGNGNRSITVVIYAPNLLNKNEGNKFGYYPHPAAKGSHGKKGTSGQCHFERNAGEMLRVFLNNIKDAGDKDIVSAWDSLFVHLDLYWHSTEGTTDVCAETCRPWFKNTFFKEFKGDSNFEGVGSPKAPKQVIKCDKCKKIPIQDPSLIGKDCTTKKCNGHYELLDR